MTILPESLYPDHRGPPRTTMIVLVGIVRFGGVEVWLSHNTERRVTVQLPMRRQNITPREHQPQITRDICPWGIIHPVAALLGCGVAAVLLRCCGCSSLRPGAASSFNRRKYATNKHRVYVRTPFLSPRRQVTNGTCTHLPDNSQAR
jgi:hypothetical protein